MTVTVKQRAKTKPVVSAKETLAKKVALPDLYVTVALALKEREEQLEPLREKKQELEKMLLDQYGPTAKDDEDIHVLADGHRLDFSAVPQKLQSVDKEAVIAKLDQDTFNEIAEISVAKLKKYLSGDEFDAVTTYAREGKRRITIVKTD